MKKFLVLGLILAVAGGAFAQFTFSGQVWSGVAVVIPDGGDAAVMLASSEGTGWRVRLNGNTTFDDGNAGAAFRIQASNTATAAIAPIMEFGFGWLRTLDGQLTIRAGRIDAVGRGYGTMAGVDTDNGIHGLTGLRFDFDASPEVAVALGIAGGSAPGAVLEDITAVFGVNYLVPDTFRTVVNFTTAGDMAAALGVRFLQVEAMGFGFSHLSIDAGFFNLSDFFAFGRIDIGQRIVYTGVEGVEFGARFLQQIPLYLGADAGFNFYFWGIYNEGIMNGFVIPRFDFAFNFSGALPAAGINSVRNVWDSVPRGRYNGNMVLGIRPSVQIRLRGADNRSIELAYTGVYGIKGVEGVNHAFSVLLTVGF